jgi:hypothetical protein
MRLSEQVKSNDNAVQSFAKKLAKKLKTVERKSINSRQTLNTEGLIVGELKFLRNESKRRFSSQHDTTMKSVNEMQLEGIESNQALPSTMRCVRMVCWRAEIGKMRCISCGSTTPNLIWPNTKNDRKPRVCISAVNAH